ncbi:hypothetical protein BD769DRAFT_1388130 [Suillus cothurnatus]|nr:hypothetical protein BD769DRAFT_1388130 [Suillus cothurnatus]
MYDPALQGTLQYRWMRMKKNVKLEITWSQLWHWFTPSFEMLLDEGVENGWYDSDNILQVYQDCVNNTLKRPDCNKVLPHGVPNLIYESADNFGALEFKVTVKQDAIDHVHNIYVKPNHPVFNLVPKPLSDLIQDCYDNLGCPPHSAQIPAIVNSLTDVTNSDEEPLPLLENQKDLFFYGDTDNASDHCQLDELAELDEPGVNLLPTAPIIEEESLVIT